ncbi:MAG: signal peptidase II [Micrococcaceae bacterium]
MRLALNRHPYLTYIGFSSIALVLDFISKQLIIHTMQEGQSIPILGNLLRFTFIRNSGAAFSIGTKFTWVFTLIAFIAIAVITVFMAKVKAWTWSLCLGLITGGTLGNLMDRLFREPALFHGSVVDFIQLPHFAIFNIADSCIVIGGFLMILLVFKEVDYDKV